MAEPERRTTTTTTTWVRYIATSTRSRRNPPSLGDLRLFVHACEGLPGDVHVSIDEGPLDGVGRRDVEFSVKYEHPAPQEEPADARVTLDLTARGTAR